MADHRRSSDPAPLDERRKRALMDLSLVLLLHRAGGTFTFTEAEYEAAVASCGGRTRMNLRLEIVRAASGSAVELRLESKRPANGALPS